MQKITIPDPENETLTAQFIALYQVLSRIDRHQGFSLEYSPRKKQYPLITLPLFVCGHDQRIMTTLPITCFSNKVGIKARDKAVEEYIENLSNVFGQIDGAENAISLPIFELVSNIFEHSRKEEGWAFAHLDKQKKYLEISIADSGIGLTESYRRGKNLKLSDADAIGEAIIGNSTKSEYERGYGIKTSKNIICKELKGSFLIFSGKAVLIAEGKEEKLIELDKSVWDGVILGYKIPIPEKPVNIYPYLE